MAKGETDGRSNSSREREHAAMLETALARPGVREIMRVYDDWWERDRSLDVYRVATKNPVWATTTDSSNVS